MKKFIFPLDRVMEWRRTQAKVEEARLEKLYVEERAIDAREEALREECSRAEQSLLTATNATGFELAALDRFKRYTAAERARLGRDRAECRKKIASQSQVVSAKRRDVRLLERLKEKKFDAWTKELAREIEREAGEAYLRKWSAGRGPSLYNGT
jgi:flagellar export protein FliJ